jgi:hypothetical protein
MQNMPNQKVENQYAEYGQRRGDKRREWPQGCPWFAVCVRKQCQNLAHTSLNM